MTDPSVWFQVYKTQLERVGEDWQSRMGDFERVNVSLQVEMAQLQQDNDELRTKVSYQFQHGVKYGHYEV